MFSYIFQTLTTSTASEPSWRVQLSGVMGSTSLACWIVLLMPQLIEQWRLKSAEGIAIGFISIWFLGDVFNLIGALWAGLLPEVIFLAVWFCIADSLMIVSYFYYTKIYPKRHAHHNHHHHKKQKKHSQGQAGQDEGSPLLTTSRSRRSSTLTDIALEPEYHSVFIKYVLPILFVVACGALGFFISGPSIGDGDDVELPGDDSDETIKLGPQIMGYCSALLYLGARIPQIIQNHQRKSVHGLSLLFFLFSTLGNLTYAGQILFFRSDAKYILLNLSWLLGSLGTILEDSFIFLQFYIYRDNDSESPLEITP
ncbi:putative vacuolar amino acid transporter YPQ3 [Candida viswanathii]|uniref:Putative vacuolar amino acid transporter YPQ3 n=1 Tax=Candida viswanathii TaxID=5486 RepID=A0A367YP43_9ASCO|nr:putative vacuolar amino acid transporter YPQ3 [Candida viswanathii]